ncbi:MAG: heparin lyase I family protein [Gloeobacteraceae cyanobacterium ES-bin-144]|nr:heparin lyase I family protein [Verrucomicrobiales bacterium]
MKHTNKHQLLAFASAILFHSTLHAQTATPLKGVVGDLPKGIIQVIDFESGDFSQASVKEGGKKEVVSDPVRKGKHALMVQLTKDQKRTEIGCQRSEKLGEFKYGWSVFIPKEFDADSWFTIVSQWHDYGSGKQYIEDNGPPTHLYIAKSNWRFKLRFQDGATNNTAKQEWSLGPIEECRGKWTDFVMEANWQSPQTGGGYMRLYMNGKEVIKYEGPTWYDGKTAGPYFKVGMYRGKANWKGEEDKSILYYDELRMGGAKTTKDEVDPAKQK